jgi:alkylation response protein AidB-like acyl-CoA dehydrogenase
MWCTGAGLPDTSILMYVRTDRDAPKHQGISVVLVDPEADGVTLQRIPTLARHILGTYEVFLDDVVVPKRDLVGPLNEGWRVMLSNLELERILLSAGYVGAAQSTLDLAVEYAKERKQFDRPIANFQLVQELIAEMVVDTDAARLLVWRAGHLKDQGRPSTLETSIAKYHATEAAVRCANAAIQVHGGYGYIDEYPVERYMRDARVTTLYEGTSQIQKMIIGRHATGINALIPE